jgi:SAM-dependent methyltransferase
MYGFAQSKSTRRRYYDGKFHNKYFNGYGIDIGGAPDPFNQYIGIFPLIKDIKIWDIEDGDAQFMHTCKDESFDFVISSHCLEHLNDPYDALKNWIRIVKPGGYLIITVPDEDLYEQKVFPSKYNPDHKWTFTIYKENSWSNKSINIIELLKTFSQEIEIEKIEKIDDFYYHNINNIDQTIHPNIEANIEIILKKTAENITIENSTAIWYNSERNQKQFLYSNFSNLYENIKKLKEKNFKYLVYGDGTFGQIIKQILDEKFIGFINKNTNNENIKHLKYDYIIISLLGRENEVINFLVKNLNIDKNLIKNVEL